MNVSPEKMLSAIRSTAEIRVHELAVASDSLLSGVEHLTALNLNTGRALLDEAIAFTQAAASAREPRTLVELQIGSITPVLRHGHAWFTTAGTVAGQAQADALRLLEAGVSQWLQGVILTLELLHRSAPAGSALTVQALRSVVANATSAYDGATRAAAHASATARTHAGQAASAALEALDRSTSATVSLIRSAA